MSMLGKLPTPLHMAGVSAAQAVLSRTAAKSKLRRRADNWRRLATLDSDTALHAADVHLPAAARGPPSSATRRPAIRTVPRERASLGSDLTSSIGSCAPTCSTYLPRTST